MSLKQFLVILDGIVIDTLFYESRFTAGEVEKVEKGKGSIPQGAEVREQYVPSKEIVPFSGQDISMSVSLGFLDQVLNDLDSIFRPVIIDDSPDAEKNREEEIKRYSELCDKLTPYYQKIGIIFKLSGKLAADHTTYKQFLKNSKEI